MDAIYGVTMEALAEILAEHGAIRAQHGEEAGRAEFEQYLVSRGLDWNTWALANNAWHDRWKADPTGKTEAQFHMMVAQHTQKAHFADVRDMSADTEEGITLDQYAQITVEVSRAGADADAIVKKFGLQDVAHWQRANAAWTAKMGADTTHALTMQYGQLYSKYAGPSFQQEMLDQTADILAKNNARRPVDEPQVELTPELCLAKMKSTDRDERWTYARRYAHFADLNNVPDKAAAITTVRPMLLEMIERHDEKTTSDAEDGARKLWDLEDRSDDFRGAVGRCLNRAREKLVSVGAAFEPIKDKAVPERIFLQSTIQSYESLIETMEKYQNEDWTPVNAPVPPTHQAAAFAPTAPAFPASPFASPSFQPPAPKSAGFPKWVLAPAIAVVVLGGIAVTKMKAPKAEAASSPTVASAVVPPTTAEPAPAAAPVPPQPAAHAPGEKKGSGAKKKH